MPVRCKFRCSSVKKYLGYANSKPDQTIYAYEFQAVTGSSPENQEFFSSTPSGSLSISAVRDDLFEIGKEYYLDFSSPEKS